MAADDDVWTLEIGARLHDERQKRSRSLLEQLDRLAAEIAAAGQQKDVCVKLEQERKYLRHQFAQHLGEEIYWEPSDSRIVRSTWLVRGVPSQKYREEARSWMEQRGLSWNGSAPPLRHQVRMALNERNKPVPDHKFGLHVERTVDIQLPRSFTINLLGRPYHVVASAGGPTSAERQEEREVRKFFQDED